MTPVDTTESRAGPKPRWTVLRVARAQPIADDIHEFELRHPEGAPLPEFTAGAHVSLLLPSGVIRKYSLANDPSERERYVIAVKRETAGRGGSIALLDSIRVGHLIQVTAPANEFALDERAASYLFIAGGIGITPIMSMIRHLESSGRGAFKLYYCTRDAGATAFLDELSAPRFGDRVTIHHDHGDPDQALDLWPLLERASTGSMHLYCCGPRSMMEAVRDMTGHWSRPAVHFESFVDAEQTRTAADRPFSVRLARSGTVVPVPANQSILEALRAAGHEVQSSCESGTCGTCRVRLLGGRADHRDYVLAEDEQTGYIMVCVSRAVTDELILDR